MTYLKQHGTRRVPQRVALTGQTPNSAGGNAWAVDCWTRLRRFLVLGSEGGSYYASQWTLTRENAKAVEQCVGEDGPRAVAEIVRISTEGRAPRKTRPSTPSRSPQALGTRPPGRPLSQRCRRWHERERTCSSSPVSSRTSAAGALAATGRRTVVHRQACRRARLPGGEVPEAGRHDPPRPAPARAPRATDRRWQPVARRVGRARAPVRVDRPGRHHGRPAPPDRGLHPRTEARSLVIGDVVEVGDERRVASLTEGFDFPPGRRSGGVVRG